MKRRQFKNSIIYVLLGFLSPALNFFLIPLYTKFLSTEHYGIITISTVLQSVLGSFIGIGVSGAYYRFYFDYETEKERQRLLDTCISINIISTVFAAVFLLFLGDKLLLLFFNVPDFTMAKYGWWTLSMALISVLQILILSEYRNQERANLYAILSAVFFLSGVGGVFTGVVFLKLNAIGVIAGRAIGMSLPILTYLIYTYSRRRFKTNSDLIAPLLSYGYPIMIYGLLAYFYNNIDKLLISNFFDVSTLGLYGFAVSIAAVAEIMVHAMNNTFKPPIYKLMKKIQEPDVLDEVRLLFNYILSPMLFFILSFVAFSTPAIYLFINESYHGTLIWMPLLFVSYTSRVYYIVYSVPVFYYKKTRVLPAVTLITLIFTAVASWLLIPYFGVFALIIVGFLANALQVVSVIIYSKQTGIFNDKLYSFPQVHAQYIAVFLAISFGYILYYSIFNRSIYYFMGYNISLWIVGTIAFLMLNRRYFKAIIGMVSAKFTKE